MRDTKTLIAAGLALGGAFLAGSLAFRTGPAEAQQGSSTSAGGTVAQNNRFIAATGSVGSGMSVLWLVDTEGKRVLIYGTNSLGKNIELRAARNIEWDLKLDEFMDESQYKSEDLKRLAERQHQPPQAPPKEPPPAGPSKDAPK